MALLILNECLVGFCCDGASVMLGRKAGVFTKLKSKCPCLIGWHCLNHRLELSVGVAVKCCTEINHFTNFMDKLYSLYHQSPRNQRDGLSSLRNRHSVKKDWSSPWCEMGDSSYRTVKAVWKMHSALYSHFCSASKDTARSS